MNTIFGIVVVLFIIYITYLYRQSLKRNVGDLRIEVEILKGELKHVINRIRDLDIEIEDIKDQL